MLKDKSKNKPDPWARLFFALAALSLGFWLIRCTWPEPKLRVTFLDVGQGDSAVLETSDGAVALVDAGPAGENEADWNAGRRIVVPYLRRRGIRNIDLVFLTHPHADHVGGMAAVLNAFPARMVVDIGIPHPSAQYKAFLKAAKLRKASFVTARRGQMFKLGRYTTIRVLNPPERLFRGTRDDINNNSLVLLVECDQIRILLAGDIEAQAEAALLNFVPKIDLLKVPHHGSRFGSTVALLSRCRPQVAVVSVGRNLFGHPAPEALGRLAFFGAQVLRTDKHGAVTVETNGRRLAVRTMIKPAATHPRPG